MWNHHLLSPAFALDEPKERSRWVLPLIHGFVDQASECSPSHIKNKNRDTDAFRDTCFHKDCLLDFDREAVETLRWSEIPDERSERECRHRSRVWGITADDE
jgi:hypothetical protein